MDCWCNFEIAGKVLCILLLMVQGGILDYYLIKHHELESLGFITTDVLVLAVWIGLMVLAKRRFDAKKKRSEDEADARLPEDYPDEIPYAYIAWAAYAIVTLIPEVAVIFKHFADELGDSKVYGQNILKVALCITPMIFLLLVNSHHDSKPHSGRKIYVDKLTGCVTLDLLDSVDILEILFMDDFELNLPTSLENAIIAFACINFLLPILALLELRVNKFDGQVRSVRFQLLYSMCYILLVNIPFLVIRFILWYGYEQDVSVFIGKNMIATAIYLLDIYDNLGPHRPKQCSICGRSFNPSIFKEHRQKCRMKQPKSKELKTIAV